MNSKEIKQLVVAGLLLAIGLVLPGIFHTTGIGGKVLLPMHIPVLLGGFLLNPILAVLLGVLTPLLSSLFTGMPIMMPMGIIMMVELGLYALIASILYRKLGFPMIFTLILSMIGGRIGAGLVVYILGGFFGVDIASPLTFIMGAITTGAPGIIIQIILIPGVVYLINRYTTINIDW